MTHTCIYTKQSFEPSTREHILQAALGAKWKSGVFCSPSANSLFSKIDKALSDTVEQFRVLLGVDGDHGEAPPLKNIRDGDGRTYTIKSGGDFSLSKPFIKVEPTPEGAANLYAELRDEKQIEWAAAEIIKAAKTMFPNVSFTQAMMADHIRAHSQTTRAHTESPLHFRVGMGGDEALRAITKCAFNLLGVNEPRLALHERFDPVRDFILHGVGEASDFIRWGAGPALESPRIGPVDHFLAVWSDRHGVWAHCQLFAALVHPIRLCATPVDERLRFGYLVDPLREATPAEDREPAYSPKMMEAFEGAAKIPEQGLWQPTCQRITRLLSTAKQRMLKAEITRLIMDGLNKHFPKLPAPVAKEVCRRLEHDFMNEITSAQ